MLALQKKKKLSKAMSMASTLGKYKKNKLNLIEEKEKNKDMSKNK